MGFLQVNNLGKAYRRYRKKSGRLLEWCGMGRQHDLIWILREISFSVSPGEAIGIVGANGSGKSTLLKMVTGTTRPSTGTIVTNGRVAALLELGLGFHPDFTGRQNVSMAGQLLGLKPSEIDQFMPHIEAFAEIGDYIDQPVRVYSSGMQVRLAFSVATAVRPDILIVDEALSVGDTYFQHKSFDRIRQFRDAGTTLLFVSHSADTIKTLCNRAILLHQGKLLLDDAPDSVMNYYNALIATKEADYQIRQAEKAAALASTRSGTGAASIRETDLFVKGESIKALQSGDPATIQITFTTSSDLDDLAVGILIRDRLGNNVFGTNTYHHNQNRNVSADSCYQISFEFPALQLGVGSYSVSVALHSSDNHISNNYDWWDRALVFEVLPGSGPTAIGVCNLPVSLNWRN